MARTRRSTRPPKRRTLSQEQIVQAALALLDEVGLDALTMRRLAARLGVEAASLYRHVRDKTQLLALLGDEIAGEIPLPEASGDWRARLKAMARAVRRGLLAHRDGPQVLASTPPSGARRLRHVEAVLQILRDAGLSDRDAARAAYHMNNVVTEFASDEARLDGFAAASGQTRARILADLRRSFASLPPDEYPTIVALAAALTEDAQDELFEYGLEMCLRGIDPRAP